ncbi:general secretory pathway protein E [Thermocrinis albus DSM 14484]|uniref:General secretory pathway protein E n=2 Tax=Thermocrinis TaxID=75905 RepID=D3SMY9_THEAH|nr:general secretory pathway protein E [Thermocrinis albus]ADC90119.1 general secretory pathway protein E [Thermocrinis albus DSM 14484]
MGQEPMGAYGSNFKKIGQILIEKGLITQQQLEEALQYQRKYGGRLGWILASLGYIKRLDLYKVLSEQLNLELNFYPNVTKFIDLNFLKKFDPYILARYECIPAKEEGENVLVYTSYPDSEKLREFSEKYLKK